MRPDTNIFTIFYMLNQNNTLENDIFHILVELLLPLSLITMDKPIGNNLDLDLL